MPRKNRSNSKNKTTKPNDKAWERRMMNSLRRDSFSKVNPEGDPEFEHPFGCEHGSYGDMFDHLNE